MTIIEDGTFVQYCHSIPYIDSKGREKRMTLRLEHYNNDSIIVTKSVCSQLDSFTRKTGREHCILKRKIYTRCRMANSKNLISSEKFPPRTLNFLYKDKTSKVDVTFIEHINKNKTNLDVCQIFTFEKDHNFSKKEMVEIVMKFYSNSDIEFEEFSY